MAALLRQVLVWFLGFGSRLFTGMLNNYLATKIVLGTLFVVILPIVLNNLIFDLMDKIFSTIHSYASSSAPALQSSVNFTGLAGYLLSSCGLIDAMTIVLSACVFRFALSWIPFVGPK